MMQGKAKIYKIPPKFTENVQNFAKKKKPLFAYKTLVLLKKKVKIDVSTYETVQ